MLILLPLIEHMSLGFWRERFSENAIEADKRNSYKEVFFESKIEDGGNNAGW